MILPVECVKEKLTEMNLPGEVKEVAIAVVEGKLLRKYTLPDLIDAFIILINQTHINTAIPYNEVVILPTIELLATDMALEYGGLTFKEVEIAFKRGWKGNYGGELYGVLANKTYFKFLICY